MGRPSKKTEQEAEVSKQVVADTEVSANESEKISDKVIETMRLYPQYEEMWITSRGFVHPVGSPDYLLKDAKLYKNKYYNK